MTPKQIEQGIRETHWPGRFQVVPPSAATHQREMVLDVAHNPAGAWALRSALSENFPGRELTFVFAAMRDKPLQEMAEILFPLAEQVVVTHGRQSARGDDQRVGAGRLRAQELRFTRRRRSPQRWPARATLSKPDGVIVVTGSIFLVGEAMTLMGLQA